MTNEPQEELIAGTIYERKEMMEQGQGGSVLNDLAHAFETGNYQEFEDYFGDQDPFEFL